MLGVCGGALAAGALPLPVEGRIGSRPSTAAASTTIRTSVRFVGIQRGVMVGANSKVESNVLICEEVEVELEDEVLVGGVLVVTRDVAPGETVAGVPARRRVRE
jgi:serine acetyltransferase